MCDHLEVCVAGRRFTVHTDRAVDVSLALEANRGKGRRRNAFGLPEARVNWLCLAGNGASVSVGCWENCCVHGAGTHTECIGHIMPPAGGKAEAVITLEECGAPLPPLVPALLLTVSPVSFGDSGDTYGASANAQDFVVCARALAAAEQAVRERGGSAGLKGEGFYYALVVRTLPNGDDKKSRVWTGSNPPYLTREAAQWMVERSVQHLLVDLPSVDREDDGGKLVAHRCLLRAPDEGVMRGPTPHTITEFCYVPDSACDGNYVLNLQVPAVDTEAAPSRPVLFPVTELRSPH